MRLWSLAPAHLDRKRLLAVWREGLLAQKVLMGETRGYKNHPQLDRFKAQNDPVAAIGYYLQFVQLEAKRRGYNFNEGKIKKVPHKLPIINVTDEQVRFEARHLEKKTGVPIGTVVTTHPLFDVIPGPKEPWERG